MDAVWALRFRLSEDTSVLPAKHKLFNVRASTPLSHSIASSLTKMLGASYAAIGGYSGDLGQFNGFFVMDIDKDPEPDLALYYKKKHGTKIAALATDTDPSSKSEVMRQLEKLLATSGTWLEVSGAVANILLKKAGLKSLDDEAVVRKALGKELEWHGAHPEGLSYGNGWYTRTIDGHARTKIVVGRPRA